MKRDSSLRRAIAMRFQLSAIVVLVAVASAHAQEAAPEAPAPKPIYAADGLIASDKHHDAATAGLWRTDIIFGLPIALRAQRRINESIWAEGGVALYGLAPSIFAGLRLEGRVYEGQRNAWYSRPGVDVYYSPVRGSRSFFNGPFKNIVAVTFENDLAWRRAWTDRLHGHLGLKAGFGIAVAGSNLWPVPVLGLTCGFQY